MNSEFLARVQSFFDWLSRFQMSLTLSKGLELRYPLPTCTRVPCTRSSTHKCKQGFVPRLQANRALRVSRGRSIHSGPRNKSNFGTDARKNAATRGGHEERALTFSVSSPHPEFLKRSAGKVKGAGKSTRFRGYTFAFQTNTVGIPI
jgi:hypothetical protein